MANSPFIYGPSSSLLSLVPLTAYSLLAGGATATPDQLQQVSGVGTSGQVLTSQGAGALPAWATISGFANTALSNLTTTSINQSLVPNANGTLNLGSTANAWGLANIEELNDGGGGTSIEVYTRRLYSNSGSNITLDWELCELIDLSATVQLTWQNNTNPGVYISSLTANEMVAATTSGRLVSVANSTAGFVLTSNGAGSAPTFQASSGGSPTAPTQQIFTSGSATYTPTSNSILYIRVRAVGAGAGGAGGGTGATDGGGGGSTNLGSYVLCNNTGPGGGVNDANGNSGAGGSASFSGSGVTGTAIQGGTGTAGAYMTTGANNTAAGGCGAASPFGGEGGGGFFGGSGQDAAANSGAGGGGGGYNTGGGSVQGGAGGGGSCGGFVDVIISGSSLATIKISGALYAVGAGGSGGSAGTNGQPGGAGGSGYIEITEYYQ